MYFSQKHYAYSIFINKKLFLAYRLIFIKQGPYSIYETFF
jgi:hypothetical protein